MVKSGLGTWISGGRRGLPHRLVQEADLSRPGRLVGNFFEPFLSFPRRSFDLAEPTAHKVVDGPLHLC
jgi:hypothetical protein